jgi:choline transport protein
LPEKLLFRNTGWAPVAIRLESRDIIAPYTTVECDRWILLTIHQMMATVFLNGALGFVMIVTFCFAIQSVEEQVIMSTSPYPFVDIFATATGSTAAAIGMTVPMVLMTLSMCINSTAAASRQAWSFARDDGLPFPRWFTRLVPINSTPLPINAMIMSLVILIVVALLNFGGSEVFNSIIGLMTGAVGLTYALSIGCVLWRRLYGDPLPPARWSLGRWGVPINIIALLYEVFSTVISFFPLFAKVDAKMMNWGTISFPFTRLGVSA